MTTAPELSGDTWFAVDRERLSIRDFRGRFLLLDFWTLCCVNCHHVLAELRPIEEKYAAELTVVGVHSPKFEHEKKAETVFQAIARHDIPHPVLNDPDMTTWQAYGVRAWPTLVLVDPEGEIIATYSGEGHGHAIDALLEEKIPQYEAKGSLIRGDGVFVPLEESPRVFRQPGKVSTIPVAYREHFRGADLLVSDSGGHRLAAISHAEPGTVLWSTGTGSRGRTDGALGQAQFCEPYGVSWVSPDHADALGFHVVVADTANHLIRGISLTTGLVSTLAGTGAQWMQQDPTSGVATDVALTTPWDVVVEGTTAIIAMAGDHRLWSLDLANMTVGIFAGTSNEGLVDGTLETSWFAQPSALVGDRDTLWVIDSETSALRLIRDQTVTTVVGTGLFDFGHVDGVSDTALFQHPLGAAVLADGSVVIADSYNGAIRCYNPDTNQVTTLHRGLLEPSDVAVVDTPQGLRLAVVEASAHRVSILGLPAGTVHRGEQLRTVRLPLAVRPGVVEIEVVFAPPPGQKRDDRYGPSTQLVVSATPRGMIEQGVGTGVELTRRLTISPQSPSGVLHVQAKGASCEEGEFAACHIHQQDWGIPVVLSADGASTIQLVLSGTPEPS